MGAKLKILQQKRSKARREEGREPEEISFTQSFSNHFQFLRWCYFFALLACARVKISISNLNGTEWEQRKTHIEKQFCWQLACARFFQQQKKCFKYRLPSPITAAGYWFLHFIHVYPLREKEEIKFDFISLPMTFKLFFSWVQTFANFSATFGLYHTEIDLGGLESRLVINFVFGNVANTSDRRLNLSDRNSSVSKTEKYVIYFQNVWLNDNSEHKIGIFGKVMVRSAFSIKII